MVKTRQRFLAAHWDGPLERVIFKPDKAHQRSMIYLFTDE
jgi:hypothetical protein